MSERKIVTREQFLKPLPRQTEYVPVPEFGEGYEIPVCSLYTGERNEYEAYFTMANGKPNTNRLRNVRQMLVVYCCRDESGRQLFTVDDVAALAEQLCPVVERLVEVAVRINNMAKDVEKLEKNSDATGGA